MKILPSKKTTVMLKCSFKNLAAIIFIIKQRSSNYNLGASIQYIYIRQVIVIEKLEIYIYF